MAKNAFRRSYPYIYRWTKEIDRILPEHYKQRCQEFMLKDPTPVHWRPNPNKYRVVESTGERVPVQNVPLDVRYPPECNKGLWGGEGVVVGYIKKKPRATWLPRLWRPFLQKRILYSEILNKHFVLTVTLRTLDLIDEHYGFDNYILKTHEVDLCSKLGMDLKREMLLALVRKSLYPDDPVKQKTILEKYKEFIMPEEEAEWIGLSAGEAIAKAKQLEKENNPSIPLKESFMVEFMQKLNEESLKEKSESFLSKLNPFTSEPPETKEKR